MSMNNLENDIPKYVKKKKSNVSKSNSKSKHKHEYTECLFVDHNYTPAFPRRGFYCKICGKINDVKLFETIKSERGNYYVQLSSDEVYEKYKNLEKVHISSIWQKYVTVSKGGE